MLVEEGSTKVTLTGPFCESHDVNVSYPAVIAA